MQPTVSQTLTINGQPQPYQAQTVRELLISHGLDPDKPGIAVAINNEVIRRAEWAHRQIAAGDRVEVVHALAGG